MEIFVSLDLMLQNSMQKSVSCFVLNYSKELEKVGTYLYKELNSFTNKYHKILVLDKQKEIEINLILDEKLAISSIKKLINVRTFRTINKDELTNLVKNRIITILENDNVFVPLYIKEEVNNLFNVEKKIKSNLKDTEEILKEIKDSDNYDFRF